MDWFDRLKKAVEKVISDMMNLSDEEFEAEIKAHEEEFGRGSFEYESVPECTLDTCSGECQGMGWCDLATDFRNAIIPPIINEPHPIGCKCNKCTNMELVL
jgi:hypothetical protein